MLYWPYTTTINKFKEHGKTVRMKKGCYTIDDRKTRKHGFSRKSVYVHRAPLATAQHLPQSVEVARAQAAAQSTPEVVRSVEDHGAGKVSDINNLARVILQVANKPQGRFDLCPFSGLVSEWLIFKRSYDDSKESYSPSENLSRLRYALRGEAREAVGSLLVTSDDPEEVIQSLELRFARPQTIIRDQLAALRAMPRLGRDPRELNILASKVRNCVSVVNLLRQTPYIHSPELTQNVVCKLSPLLQNKWYDYAAGHPAPGVPLLEILSQFLEREAARQTEFGVIEVVGQQLHSERGRAVQPLHRAPGLRTTVNPYTPQPPRQVTLTSHATIIASCSFCSGDHTIKSCPLFIALTTDERWSWVRQNKVCARCLKKEKHNWYRCKAKRCGFVGCTRAHHQLLHSNLSKSQTSESHSNVISQSSTSVTSSVEKSDYHLEKSCWTWDNYGLLL